MSTNINVDTPDFQPVDLTEFANTTFPNEVDSQEELTPSLLPEIDDALNSMMPYDALIEKNLEPINITTSVLPLPLDLNDLHSQNDKTKIVDPFSDFNNKYHFAAGEVHLKDERDKNKALLFLVRESKLFKTQFIQTERNDSETIKSMVEFAKASGWHSIKINGKPDFKREAWLEASSNGLNVKGYIPTDLDLKKLREIQESRAINKIEPLLLSEKITRPVTDTAVRTSEEIAAYALSKDFKEVHGTLESMMKASYFDTSGLKEHLLNKFRDGAQIELPTSFISPLESITKVNPSTPPRDLERSSDQDKVR